MVNLGDAGCINLQTVMRKILTIINRLGVVGAVQQAPLSFIHLVTHSYPLNLQNTFPPKPLE